MSDLKPSGFASVGTLEDNRNIKALQNNGNEVTMGVGAPRQAEGKVGDITIRQIPVVGLRMFVKTHSGWYDINAMVTNFQPKWIPMNLDNSWTVDATFLPPAYFKDLSGFVHLRGAVDDQDTAVSNRTDDITILPEGFRPQKTIHRIVIREALAELQQIRIQASGAIDCPYAYTLEAGAGAGGDEVVNNSTNAVSIDGISFFAGKQATSVHSGQESEQSNIGQGITT